MVIIQESQKVKGKRYRCQYCGEMHYRDDLIDHIIKEHEELIPENYTARRIVFNQINKKEVGHCTICGKEVEWNENIGRYEKFCCEACKIEAGRRAEENLKRKTGMGRKERMSIADVQNQLLSKRSISGTYTFSTGGRRDYVGSYEKKALEFFDLVLNLKAIHISTPGPVIEYEYEGKKHFWITDQYIEPFNLAIDCKDGGDNPNKRNMPEYRAKQEAKEKAIAKQGVYNYIRLTNNNFEQIFEAIMEIKSQLLLPPEERHMVIRINESEIEMDDNISISELSSNEISSIIQNCYKNNIAYVTVYEEEGETKYAISDIPQMYRSIVNDGEDLKVVHGDTDQFEEATIFKFSPNKNIDKDFVAENILELLTQSKIISEEQLYYDSQFSLVPTIEQTKEMTSKAVCNTILKENGGYTLPSLNNPLYENVSVFKSPKGIYLENINNHFRSGYYENIPPDYVFEYINKGMI